MGKWRCGDPMARPKALDLFCGAGGTAMGLHRAGFDAVGIDIKRQYVLVSMHAKQRRCAPVSQHWPSGDLVAVHDLWCGAVGHLEAWRAAKSSLRQVPWQANETSGAVRQGSPTLEGWAIGDSEWLCNYLDVPRRSIQCESGGGGIRTHGTDRGIPRSAPEAKSGAISRSATPPQNLNATGWTGTGLRPLPIHSPRSVLGPSAKEKSQVPNLFLRLRGRGLEPRRHWFSHSAPIRPEVLHLQPGVSGLDPEFQALKPMAPRCSCGRGTLRMAKSIGQHVWVCRKCRKSSESCMCTKWGTGIRKASRGWERGGNARTG